MDAEKQRTLLSSAVKRRHDFVCASAENLAAQEEELSGLEAIFGDDFRVERGDVQRYEVPKRRLHASRCRTTLPRLSGSCAERGGNSQDRLTVRAAFWISITRGPTPFRYRPASGHRCANIDAAEIDGTLPSR